jgi:hypothetical protein
MTTEWGWVHYIEEALREEFRDLLGEEITEEVVAELARRTRAVVQDLLYDEEDEP